MPGWNLPNDCYIWQIRGCPSRDGRLSQNVNAANRPDS